MSALTNRQYEPITIPQEATQSERRAWTRLQDILDDIYLRYGRLSVKDLAKSTVTEINRAGVFDSLQVKDLQGTLLRFLTAEIGSLTVDNAQAAQLSAQVITALEADLAKAKLGEAEIESLKAEAARIAQAEITRLNAGEIQAGEVFTGILEAVQGKIRELTAQDIHTGTLTAALAQISLVQTARAEIGSADVGFAQVKDLVTGSAVITQGTGGDLYIARLRVTDANMVSLTTGKLVVKGADGKYYQLTVGGDGQVVPVEVKIEGGNIGEGTITGGNLIENAITARELNAEMIFADQALMVKLFAGMGKFGELFASSAVMPYIEGALIHNDSALMLKVGQKINERLIVSGTAPLSPVDNMLWLDTSQPPSLLKRWDGEDWRVVNDTTELEQSVTQSTAEITVLKNQIKNTVSQETYTAGMAGKADQDKVSELVESVLSQTAEQIGMQFGTAKEYIVEVDGRLQTALEELYAYIHFSADGIELGKSGNPFKALLDNTKLSFTQNGQEVAYISNYEMHITKARVTNQLVLGNLQATVDGTGAISWGWIGTEG